MGSGAGSVGICWPLEWNVTIEITWLPAPTSALLVISAGVGSTVTLTGVENVVGCQSTETCDAASVGCTVTLPDVPGAAAVVCGSVGGGAWVVTVDVVVGGGGGAATVVVPYWSFAALNEFTLMTSFRLNTAVRPVATLAACSTREAAR